MDLVSGIRQLRMQSTSSHDTAESEPVFMPAKPMEANPLGESVTLWSNVFPVKVHENGVKLYQYEVDVFLSKKPFTDDMEEKDKFVVTRTPFHGARAAQGKEICGKLMDYVFKEEEVLPWNQVFYDHHRTLFTTERIDNEGENIFCQILLEPDEPVFKPFAHGKVELGYKGELEFSNKSISTLNGSPSGIERAKFLGKFVEIAASKYCLDGVINNRSQEQVHRAAGAFLYLSGNRVYSTHNGEALPEDKELLLGLRKTFDLVEGTQGRGHVEFGIPMDASKVCFIRANFAIETAREICKKTFQEHDMATREDVEKLNRVLKGAVVVARYSNIHQNMKIDKIVMENACTQSFKADLGSGEIAFTVEEYFRTQRNETLRYPYAPLAQVTRGGRQSYFPLEFLGILAGNVVQTEKQTPEIMSIIVKSSAMVPFARMNAIMEQARQQRVLGPKTGLIVEDNPYEVNGRIIPPPQFQYEHVIQGQPVVQLDDRGSWKVPMRSQYVMTKKVIKKWGFFVVKDGKLTVDPNPFMEKLIRECNVKGLGVPTTFAYSGIIPSDQLETTFRKLVADEYDFAFFAMDDQLKLQDQLKYLERKYSVATQNVKLSTVEVIVQSGRPATVANIVQKLNCKMGGLNHSLARQSMQFNESFKKGDVFVLGIGDVMPLRNTPGFEAQDNLPVVLSYAGNFSTVPNALIGDFMIENLPLANAKVSGGKIFDKVCEAMAGAKRKIPKNVVIYRMGSTDLDMKHIMEHEIKEIRGKLCRLHEDARLLYIMVHKDHAVRFFKKDLNGRDNPTKQNIRPGTVVDTCVTHPHHREFYLNAHVALQGTAKTPRYTVLHDDSDSTMAYLEAMTYDLCFMHQIVNLPTALPSPLRIAEEYGNRGKRILIKHWEENGYDTKNLQNLKQALEYKYAEKFKDRRINA